jgi:hypothetical protein
VQCASSPEIVLADMHINMLGRWAPKFQAADLNRWEEIVEKAAKSVKRMWIEDIEFDKDTVINVRELSAKLGYSQTFLAYLPAFKTQKWTYHNVLTTMHRASIHKLALKLSQNRTDHYLSHYNGACRQVEKKLTDSQCQRYKVMAKEWSEKNCPQKCRNGIHMAMILAD